MSGYPGGDLRPAPWFGGGSSVQKCVENDRRSSSVIFWLRNTSPSSWVTPIDQRRWVDGALEMFGGVFGGATAYPKAQGVWLDDERGGPS